MVQSGGMHDCQTNYSFCNSVQEANEAAIKFCIKYQETKLNKENIKYRFLALKNSFHGRSGKPWQPLITQLPRNHTCQA